MAVNWTAEQERAIESRGGARLVSAAAGSGKTAVLVERVIRRLLDEREPCDIDEFLIVTFTKAAAAEMRAKIADALTERLLANPENRRLRRQLSLLDRAQIMTVHSFCADLLREHFQSAGLTPDFRVADEDEITILRETILDELIESCYEDDTGSEDFLLLVESLSAMRDDSRLRSVILETYDKLQSHPYPRKWMEEAMAEPEGDPLAGACGDILYESILDRCRYARASLQDAHALMRGYPEVEKSYGAAFGRDIAAIDRLTALLEDRRWDEAAAFAGEISFLRLGSVRDFDDPVLLELLKASRDTWKDALAAMRRDYFGFTSAQFAEDLRAVQPCVRALFSLVRAFSDRLGEEKRARNILDFSDLEHLALHMLTGEEGTERTALARTISARYTEIMVDEYQDTNDVQDAIFRALSKDETNLFMVGDIKQSIYGFRLANPEVFLRRYLAYADDPAPGEPGRIILAKNFRSRHEVTEAVNHVFENIMSTKLGDVDYSETERLIPGAEYPASGDTRAEFCLVETGESELSSAEADAAYVASRIRGMLDEGFPVYDPARGALRSCVPEDFAILLRSIKNAAGAYEAALAREGIPVLKDVGTELFRSPDVIVLMSLIDVLDNPEQDVPLASLMRSPLFGFTADELAQLRIASKGTSFHAAVRRGAEREDALGARCAQLLSTLDALRRAAEDMPADRLILRILNETKLGAVMSRLTGGDGMLRAFLEQAERFERSGYCGLYRFAQMMRALRTRGCTVSPAPSSVSAVRLLSVHKSKGLEYPIVILANCAHRFNMDDLTRPVLIHPALGAGFRRRQVGRRIEYPTLPRLAIALQQKREMLSEEERILYVAMTRAREKLIVTAPVKDAAAFAARCYPDLRLTPLPHQMLLGASSPLTWIAAPLLRLPCAAPLLAAAGIAANFPEREDRGWMLRTVRAEEIRPGAAAAPAEPRSEPLPVAREELIQRFSFRYPADEAKDIPSKLTATALKGRYTDAEAAEEAAPQLPSLPAAVRREDGAHTPGGSRFRRPRFVQDGGLTAAERGIALHLVMQLIDFSACSSPDGIRGEIARLARDRFLTPEQAAAADPAKILAFFTSPLGKRMTTSGAIHREFKFSLLAPADFASDFSALSRVPRADEDSILFQGVVDCFFEEADSLTVIDFKTDFVGPGGSEALRERYRPQLCSYGLALSRITGKPVRERHLYLFQTGEDLLV